MRIEAGKYYIDDGLFGQDTVKCLDVSINGVRCTILCINDITYDHSCARLIREATPEEAAKFEGELYNTRITNSGHTPFPYNVGTSGTNITGTTIPGSNITCPISGWNESESAFKNGWTMNQKQDPLNIYTNLDKDHPMSDYADKYGTD